MNSTFTEVGKWSPNQNSLDSITATKEACNYMQKQLKKLPQAKAIHLGIKKSGCSGYAYILEPIDDLSAFPHQFQVEDKLLIVVDEKSWSFVRGTEIDYQREGLNGIVKYRNPNETSSCGCGESFSVEK